MMTRHPALLVRDKLLLQRMIEQHVQLVVAGLKPLDRIVHYQL